MRPQVSRKNLVVFTGVCISAESGLQTFRGARTISMARLALRVCHRVFYDASADGTRAGHARLVCS